MIGFVWLSNYSVEFVVTVVEMNLIVSYHGLHEFGLQNMVIMWQIFYHYCYSF